MEVKATADGVYNRYRRKGEVFDVEFKDSNGKDVTKQTVEKASWLEPVKNSKPAAKSAE